MFTLMKENNWMKLLAGELLSPTLHRQSRFHRCCSWCSWHFTFLILWIIKFVALKSSNGALRQSFDEASRVVINVSIISLQFQNGFTNSALINFDFNVRPDRHRYNWVVRKSRTGAARCQFSGRRHPLPSGPRKSASIRKAKVSCCNHYLLVCLMFPQSLIFYQLQFTIHPHRQFLLHLKNIFFITAFSFSLIETWVFTWSWWNIALKPHGWTHLVERISLVFLWYWRCLLIFMRLLSGDTWTFIVRKKILFNRISRRVKFHNKNIARMSIEASLEETSKSLAPNSLKRFSLTHFRANEEQRRLSADHWKPLFFPTKLLN